MKDVRTREPASPTAILQTELARDSSLKTVSEFDKSNLKKAETMEKNPLPSSEAIAQELEHLKFKAGIEGYDQSSLSHATTVEKNTLPTQVSPLHPHYLWTEFVLPLKDQFGYVVRSVTPI